MKQSSTQASIEALAEKIRKADAIVIGGGSGLSSAAGYNHYHWMPQMESALRSFVEYYGFTSPFAGFYHCYPSPEAQWGYYSQYIRCMSQAPTGVPYEDLRAITEDKPTFVLTTNIDGQFSRVFSEDQICCYQGDFRYWQCSQPCHDQLYENSAAVQEMTRQLRGVCIPSDLIPRCPECGRIMVPWVRDDTFLEGSKWKASVDHYHDFLRHWLLEQTGKNVLLLELGVGEMTPSIIKLPFWEMTTKNETVFYACVNQKQSSAPEHLVGKSMYISADLADTLHQVRTLIEL